MRIISGKYRGKQIHPPGNFKARPTTDFAKEGLFNILMNHFEIEELDVLDMFAGTGSISYEFASRGARSVMAVELNPVHFKFIQHMCRNLDLEQVTVIRGDAIRFLKKPFQSFDLIFADPPYNHPLLDQLPSLLLSTEILRPGGMFILEHPARISFAATPQYVENRKYGGVNFSIFKHPDS